MSEGRIHAIANLALSLVVFALSLGGAFLGAQRDDLFSDAGRPDATAPLEVAAGQ